MNFSFETHNAYQTRVRQNYDETFYRNGRFKGRPAVEARLYAEDPWLYKCYKMLTNASTLRRTEANARRLYNEVLPRDKVCPICGVLMQTDAGDNVGRPNAVNRHNLKAASLEHILLRGMDGYEDFENLRVICLRCNILLGDAVPADLYKVADWRYAEWKQRDINGNGHALPPKFDPGESGR